MSRVGAWTVLGITAAFHPSSPDERLRPKWAAYVEIESDRAYGQVAVWTSGEAELLVIYASDHKMRTDHYDLTDAASLNSCLDDLTALVVTRPADDTLHTFPD